VDAAREGYDSSELVKRYTTATMGPAQGKLETVNTVAVLAEATGRSIEDLGTTVWRPPYAPVTLGALAGRKYAPVRVTPMHSWHQTNGASHSSPASGSARTTTGTQPRRCAASVRASASST
jgi:sarcosine oxidase subunit alpha